jgi:serine/threonine-protein phosphatase 5
MATTADRTAATALKIKGNQAFQNHDWPAAIDFYTQAIAKNDQDASFFCNRAQVRLIDHTM